jgi:hypothetical protein
VDSYYNRFHDLLDDLLEGEEPISTKSAISHFIFTLGPEFETIQNNFRIGNLPEEWKTQDWAKLLILCRDYSNSVNPLGILKRASTSDSNFLSQNYCVAHHKKVRQWFLNPTKYCVEIETEQKRYARNVFITCLHLIVLMIVTLKRQVTNNEVKTPVWNFHIWFGCHRKIT